MRYFAAADLVEALYRGLADNSVAKIIDSLLRADLVIGDELGFAPLDLAGTQLLFRFVAAAYERRSLGIASHWPFDAWGRFLPEHTTGASLLDRLLHHAVASARARAIGCGRPSRRKVAAEPGPHDHARGGDFRWPSGDFTMAIDTRRAAYGRAIRFAVLRSLDNKAVRSARRGELGLSTSFTDGHAGQR